MPRRKQTDLQIRERVALRVRQARCAKGWSQERLAEAIGVSVESISRYERGKLALSLELLERVADRLGVPIEQVVSRGPVGLSAEETALVEGWRRLSDRGRRAVLEIIRWGGEALGDRHAPSS